MPDLRTRTPGVCPYAAQVERTLPRVLALFDTDPLSSTYGQGDRFRWAWKLIDFGNATYQGIAQGLARLLVSGLWPASLGEQSLLRRIDAMFLAAGSLRRAN